MTSGIRVKNVSKKFSRDLNRALQYGVQDIWRELAWWRRARTENLRPGEFWAVRDVSFTLGPGEGLGIIGENGAGKSTLLKMLQGLLKPDTGEIEMRGHIAALDLGAGMMPWLTGRENISAQAALLGLEPLEIQARIGSIIEFAELDEFINTPVGYYSTGMRARLGFAIAAQLEPDILLVDEVLSVGDFAFQRKCREYINRFLERGGILIFVSHAVEQIQATCQHGLVLAHGCTCYQGSAVDALDYYLKSKKQSPGVALREKAETPTAPTPSEKEPVRIYHVEVAPLESAALQTGKPTQITVYYTAVRRFERIIWNVAIFNTDVGMYVAGASSSLAQTLEAGAGILRCTLPRMPLTNGTYALKIGIGDLDTSLPLAQSGWYDPAHSFHVENPPSSSNNIRLLVNVLMQLDAEWMPEPATREFPSPTIHTGDPQEENSTAHGMPIRGNGSWQGD